MNRLLLAGAILLQTAPAMAQVYAPDPFAACGALADDRARLMCYDTVRRQNTRPPPAPIPSAPALQAAPAQSPVSEFGGLKTPSPARASAPRHMSAGVVSYTFDKDNKFVVTLDNGQVWRQFLDDSGRAKFKTNGKNYVVINHVFWNSYDLKLNTMNVVFRVQRMK